MSAALGLDRGPGVVAVVPNSPAARAGIRAGDVLLSIDGAALPREPGLAEPFAASRAHARADAIQDLLARPSAGPIALVLQRDGAAMPVQLHPLLTCPSQSHLARSDQRNAFADGRHLFLTTGLVAQLRSEDELAFVIAHEMAHNILGHAAVMRSGEVRHGLGRTLGRSGRIVRSAECEADLLGGTLMLDAGYDPVAGAEALRRLGGIELGIGLFADHPSTDKRIASMRALAAARQTR